MTTSGNWLGRGVMATVAVLMVLAGRASAQGETMTRNLQINGSFEYATNPDIPDYWAGTGNLYRANGLPWEMCDEAGIAEFREKFFLDRTTAFHGSHSLRLQRPFHLLSMTHQVPARVTYTVSLYLKAEYVSRQVRIGVTRREMRTPVKEVVVTVDQVWSRHELQLDDYPYGELAVYVIPLDTGKVWVDAVQVEAGSAAAAFVPCDYDQGFTRPQPVVHPKPGANEMPRLMVAQPVAQPPSLDGRLDDAAWRNAPVITMSDYMGAPTEVATQVGVAYDPQHLYLRFSCADPGGARGLGDSVEILIDLLGIGDPYYQFIFTPGGDRRNYRSVGGLHDWSWTAEWQVAIGQGQDGWTAEVAIPFAAFPDTAALAEVRNLRMNVCRNYAPGPEKYLSWAPVTVGFLEPEGFGMVSLGEAIGDLSIADLALRSTGAADGWFSLSFKAGTNAPAGEAVTVAVGLEEQGRAAQFRTARVELPEQGVREVIVDGFRLVQQRCRASLILSNSRGQVLKHVRTFLDVPHPLRLYAEYSYYTNEPTAQVVAEFAPALACPVDARLGLTVRLAGYPQKLVEQQVTATVANGRQLVPVPIVGLRAGHPYRVEARLVDASGRLLAQATTELLKREPNQPEVKINRLNRGLYLNGAPYIPYGILTPYYELPQLRYYRKCGFDFISFVSHWATPEKGREFLNNCDQVGLNAIAFHVARPHQTPPAEAADHFRQAKRLIGMIPNDEDADVEVYDIATRTKLAYPEILTCINHNFSSYRAFANRLEGLPGDVLSIDRYPLLALPNGRPHTTSEIYSVERCIEMMDRDGERERMPLFFWLQAGERFSKEPTPREITWINYILLVNHCVGFTYFAGMPASRPVWERMIAVNKEIQELKPYLFSFEPDPVIGFADADSRQYIRVLAKRLGDELLLIGVNRAMSPIDAALELPATGQAVVVFEGRTVAVRADRLLRDRFEPLSRHVYRLKLK